MDEGNAKLIQTLSKATDMLAKADEMQSCFAGVDQKHYRVGSSPWELSFFRWTQLISADLVVVKNNHRRQVNNQLPGELNYTADIKEAREKAAQDSLSVDQSRGPVCQTK